MSIFTPVAAIGNAAPPLAMPLGGMPIAAQAPVASSGPGFGDMVKTGLQQIDAKVAHAEDMARAFALDDSVPVHQVTMALEEARMSVELAMQVRQRLVDGYRELMNMQL